MKKKAACVDYKNAILRYCENGFFLKGLTPDFRQIFESSSESHFRWKIPRHDV